MNEQEDMKEKQFSLFIAMKGDVKQKKKILFIALFVVNITINENENEKKQNLLLFRVQS